MQLEPKKIMTFLSLSAYAADVGLLAENATNKRIPNSGEAHALIVLENLFNNATRTVDIYTGALRDTFYCNPALISAAEAFISKPNTKLRVLVERDDVDLSQHPFVNAIAKLAKPSQFAYGNLKGQDSIAPMHFCVSDERAYRIETDDSTTKAVVNFNEPLIAVPLAQHFSREFSNFVS